MAKRKIETTITKYKKAEDYTDRIKDLKNYLKFDNLKIKKQNEINDSFSEDDQKELMNKLKLFLNENGYTISGHSTISDDRKTIKPFPRVRSKQKESDIIKNAFFNQEILSQEVVDVYELDLLQDIDDYLKNDKEYIKIRSEFKLEDNELSHDDFIKLKKYVNNKYHVGNFDLSSLVAQLSMFSR